jgi:hypothetical protein
LALIEDASGEAAPVVRIGFKLQAGSQNMEALFNDQALAQILAVFELSAPDADADSVADLDDNCPNTPNTDQADSNGFEDGDGIGDACEDSGGSGPVDSDGDGYSDDVDNCPDMYNPGQEDSNGFEDGTGAGDACEDEPAMSYPDEDSDGVSDANDKFIGDDMRWFDADNDGVDDSVDTCIAIANADNQTDTDADGVGDVCDSDELGISVADVSGAWRASISISGGEHANDTGDGCMAAEAKTFTEIWHIDQAASSTQLIIKFDDREGKDEGKGPSQYDTAIIDETGAIVWSDSAWFEYDRDYWETLAMNAQFTAGIITSSTVTLVQTDDLDAPSYTCTLSATLTLTRPTEVVEAAAFSSATAEDGVVWLGANDWHDETGKRHVELEYGVLSEAEEQSFVRGLDASAWTNNTEDQRLQNFYLDAARAIVNTDDLFSVVDYLAADETAVLQPTRVAATTDGFEPVAGVEVVELELFAFDLTDMEMRGVLPDEFHDVISGELAFTGGAIGYLAQITSTQDVYRFDCDENWDEWFDDNLVCDNIVPIEFVVGDSSEGDSDPVPATSLAQLLASETGYSAALAAGSLGDTSKAVEIGSGYDDASGRDFHINVHFTSSDGTPGGSSPVAHYIQHFNPSADDTVPHEDIELVAGSYLYDEVGGVAMIQFELPETLRADHRFDFHVDEGIAFLFEDAELDSSFGTVVRKGEVIPAGTFDELLFNVEAMSQISDAIVPLAP